MNALSPCVLDFMRKIGNDQDVNYRLIYDLLDNNLNAIDIKYLNDFFKIIPSPKNEHDVKNALKYDINNQEILINLIRNKNIQEILINIIKNKNKKVFAKPGGSVSKPENYTFLFDYYINNLYIQRILRKNNQINRFVQEKLQVFFSYSDDKYQKFVEHQIKYNAPIYGDKIYLYKPDRKLLIDTLFLSVDQNISDLFRTYKIIMDEQDLDIDDFVYYLFENKDMSFFLRQRNMTRIKNMFDVGYVNKLEMIFLNVINKLISDHDDYTKIVIGYKLFDPALVKLFKFQDIKDDISNIIATHNLLDISTPVNLFVEKTLKNNIKVNDISFSIE